MLPGRVRSVRPCYRPPIGHFVHTCPEKAIPAQALLTMRRGVAVVLAGRNTFCPGATGGQTAPAGEATSFVDTSFLIASPMRSGIDPRGKPHNPQEALRIRLIVVATGLHCRQSRIVKAVGTSSGDYGDVALVKT